MSLNLTNLFTALGRVGRFAYVLDTAQDDLTDPPQDIIANANVNPAWSGGLAQVYDANTRATSGTMAAYVTTAQNILQGFVLADNPAYGTSVASSLEYLRQDMIAQAASVAECTVSVTVTADSANTGTGVCRASVTRGDGLTQQNVIPEETTLYITADSYTGGATRGQEPWSWTGAPAVSSLGTGATVSTWDWDWPTGSASTVTGNCIAADQDATSTGNLLTNGDFETWTGSAPAVLDNWYLQTGTWGTSLQRSGSTDGIDGGYCIQFNTAGSVLNTIEQQFDSAETDGTQSDAGTDVEIPAYSSVFVNLWLKRQSGAISGGVMTVSLVDGSGAVIADEAGTNNTGTITLSTVTASWVAHPFYFRTPVALPSVVKLRIAITTALAGNGLLMDYVAMAVPTALYTGGPSAVVFSNPAAPFVAAPDPDAFTVQTANDYAGSTYRATWQTFMVRCFQTPSVILPYSGAPTIADTLITNA